MAHIKTSEGYDVKIPNQGQVNYNTVAGSIGLASAVLGNGFLGGLFGCNNNRCGCNEDHLVTRYDLSMEQALAAKDSEIALLKANTYNDQKAIELYTGTDFEVSLEGITLFKDEELTWTGIKGEAIPAHGVFAIVGAKGTTERGFSSGLSAKKSVLIQLMDPNGKEVDRFQRGEKGEGWGSQGLSNNSGSWSRIPDGSGKFMITESHSIGSLNASSGKDDPTVVQ